MTQVISHRVGYRLGRPATTHWDIRMKAQGEIEAAICERISRFQHDYIGRGPKDIRAHLIGDLLVVHLQGVLTAPEQRMLTALPAEKGRDLLKQVRTQLIELARPVMRAMNRRGVVTEAPSGKTEQAADHR
jgi:uncharacterized protein YbcI